MCVGCQGRKGLDHFGGGLHQLNQDALAPNRKLFVRLGVQKRDVKTCSALADTARCKAHALGREPVDCDR